MLENKKHLGVRGPSFDITDLGSDEHIRDWSGHRWVNFSCEHCGKPKTKIYNLSTAIGYIQKQFQEVLRIRNLKLYFFIVNDTTLSTIGW